MTSAKLKITDLVERDNFDFSMSDNLPNLYADAWKLELGMFVKIWVYVIAVQLINLNEGYSNQNAAPPEKKIDILHFLESPYAFWVVLRVVFY